MMALRVALLDFGLGCFLDIVPAVGYLLRSEVRHFEYCRSTRPRRRASLCCCANAGIHAAFALWIGKT
jgi:hypothetical protein